MTDPIDPQDGVELGNAMDNIAQLTGRFFRSLIDEGFTRSEALTLAMAWLSGTAQSGSSGGTT